jgi:hypothetical protein
MNASDVVGYAYEADTHCVGCAVERFGPRPHDHEDREGNPVNPIFCDDDAFEDCPHCGGTGVCRHDGLDHDCPYPTCDNGRAVRKCGDCGEALFE